MSYDIYIGEARVDTYVDDDESTEVRIVVDGHAHLDAPEFPGDDMTGKGNSRHPGYSAWADFCDATGLHGLFFGKGDDGPEGLMSRHPGAFRITTAHHAKIAAALESWRASHPGAVPGWDPNADEFTGAIADPKYDSNLARLMWLEWWFRHALATCNVPTIYNR